MDAKAAIYVRVSTDEQAQKGISLAAQRDRCRAFCKARGWDVSKVYQDAGFSAGTTNRPAFKDMLRDAKERQFSAIVVYKVDRFSRRLRDLILLLEELKQYSVNFTSVSEQIDTTTAMGEAFFQIIGVFAQLERGMVKERVELAFDRKISKGHTVNRAPLGYVYEDRRLIVDPEASKKVRDIFAMRAAGIHYLEISAQMKIPVSTLYEVIKNPTYIGLVRYRNKLYRGTHIPIIPKELFYSLNELPDGQTRLQFGENDDGDSRD